MESNICLTKWPTFCKLYYSNAFSWIAIMRFFNLCLTLKIQLIMCPNYLNQWQPRFKTPYGLKDEWNQATHRQFGTIGSRIFNLHKVLLYTVYPKKYAHGFVVPFFVVVMQSFIMNSHEVFIHIHQGYFAGTGAIVRLPQCQWSKPDGYGKISQCITTTKHSKAKTVCIFLGIYCNSTC